VTATSLVMLTHKTKKPSVKLPPLRPVSTRMVLVTDGI
jgi:hypothetical protein